MGIEPISLDRVPAAQKFTLEMENIIESIKKNIKQAQDWMKVNADKSHSAAPKYTIGQQVWLYHTNPSAPRAISIPPEDFLLLFQKRPAPLTSLHPKQIPFDRLEVDL